MLRSQVFLTAVLTAACASPALADQWKFDPAHSSAQFSVKHLMISNVKGQFSKISGTVDYDPKKPKEAKVDATIDVSSVDTREPKRDDHLRSPDFFDVAKYPSMTFKSTKVLSASKGKIKLLGDLTMHGVTKEVTLTVDGPTDPIKDQRGGERVGASASASLDRKDYNLTWNKNLDGGGVVLGDEIPITIDVELIKIPAVADAK
jgi:polyisoprenoid-binding protein YceI